MKMNAEEDILKSTSSTYDINEKTFQSVRGMHDIVGNDALRFYEIIQRANDFAKKNNFEILQTPVIEDSRLYLRNLGEESDVVSKELYIFQDKGGNSLALRPEFTAGIARFFVENGRYNGALPQKFFSYGQLFRYDRPQAGRYRQFNQLNFELFCEDNNNYDLLAILHMHSLLNAIGLENSSFAIKVNFLADEVTRARYKADLTKYLYDNINSLSLESKNRIHTNPMRILDSKDEKDRVVISKSPKIAKYYSEEYATRVEEFVKMLNETELNIIVDENLVRGLDYYDGLVFEVVPFVHEKHMQELQKEIVSASQGSILGGGRYSRLIKEISNGRANVSSVGFAIGVERLMLLSESYYRFDGKLESKIHKLALIPDCKERLQFAYNVAQFIANCNVKNLVIDVCCIEGSVSKKIKKMQMRGFNLISVCGLSEKSDSSIRIKDITITNAIDCNNSAKNNTSSAQGVKEIVLQIENANNQFQPSENVKNEISKKINDFLQGLQ